jgi:hypothetical protein
VFHFNNNVWYWEGPHDRVYQEIQKQAANVGEGFGVGPRQATDFWSSSSPTDWETLDFIDFIDAFPWPESLDFKVSEFEWFALLFHDFINQWELGTSASIPQMKSQPRWATTGSYSPVGVYPHMYDIKSKEVQSITPSDRPDRFRKTCEIMLKSYRDLRQNQGLTTGEGAKKMGNWFILTYQQKESKYMYYSYSYLDLLDIILLICLDIMI